MMKKLKNIIVVWCIIMIVFLGSQAVVLNNELNEYKKVYDGLELFEDGSWTYKEGVNEYHFWNWDLNYVKKMKSITKKGE